MREKEEMARQVQHLKQTKHEEVKRLMEERDKLGHERSYM